MNISPLKMEMVVIIFWSWTNQLNAVSEKYIQAKPNRKYIITIFPASWWFFMWAYSFMRFSIWRKNFLSSFYITSREFSKWLLCVKTAFDRFTRSAVQYWGRWSDCPDALESHHLPTLWNRAGYSRNLRNRNCQVPYIPFWPSHPPWSRGSKQPIRPTQAPLVLPLHIQC